MSTDKYEQLLLALLLIPTIVIAQEPVEFWDSVRNSQYEWTCEDDAGNVLSGHTRQDKATVSCANRALTDGLTYYVRSGTYRVFRLKDPNTQPPPPDPDPPPVEPPDPPPVDSPYFEFLWSEGDGTVSLPANVMEHFGQTAGRLEIDFTPRQLFSTGDSLRLLDIPGHLGVWVWNDGIHGEWYNDAGQRRLFRSRWGLPANGVESKIVITWDASGYSTIIDGALRIHDWQTQPTSVEPDPGAVSGVYGSTVTGTMLANGSFKLRVYDDPMSYDPCTVATVGTVNESVALDNSGDWSQGVDPACLGSVLLRWTLPTKDTNNDPLLPGIPDQVTLYETGIQLVSLDGESIMYEVTGLQPGQHCFTAKAWNRTVSSVHSNAACRSVP